ncbi:D-alanyl-D-alanine endopeptidase [Candidatus Nitrotoga sp. M5]|uniref:D-alanyl-D-alanine endopeptidase n=1 Tax=Candidatus Nitrotoga sp. M5 TaxID=2890409 RepID=UPI001EF5ACBC|nr:D-alanyl-D-alanine endopeptidase [Candidatus Nitrotoga sp. M5]CAH1387274.1 D-alanyl-D-alanine endopeptidase [Candidatus Nitrotoga sp. M5]
MYKKLIILVFLLASTMAVKAAPNTAIAHKKVGTLTKAVLTYPSSPKLRSSIALIYDEQEQRPLFSKNANAIVPIASITKLMAAMVVLDAKLPLEEKIAISAIDSDTLKNTYSRMRIGMTLTRGELLNLALMSSENRAAAALARTYPGGTKAAVAKMNAKALKLGMKNTHFRDATGLNSGNTSTAHDLVKMLSAAQHYKLIHKYTTTESHMVAAPGFPQLRYGNTNPLVRNASWDIGVSKTGYINEAGRCLVMHTRIMNRPVIIVLLDSHGKYTRVADAKRIKKWMESAMTRTPDKNI